MSATIHHLSDYQPKHRRPPSPLPAPLFPGSDPFANLDWTLPPGATEAQAASHYAVVDELRRLASRHGWTWTGPARLAAVR